jgi:hypothetical protein
MMLCSFEVDLRYLLSTAAASSWFSEQQYEKIEGWLEDVVGLREERRLRTKAEQDARLESERSPHPHLRMQLDVAVERAVSEAVGLMRHRIGEQLDVLGIGPMPMPMPVPLVEPPRATVGVDATGDGRANYLVSGVDRNLDGIPDVLQVSYSTVVK